MIYSTATVPVNSEGEITADGIDVVRILHERMDYGRHIP